MFSHKNIDIVGTNVQYIDDKGNKLNIISNLQREHNKILKKLLWKSEFYHPTVLAKSGFFKDLNGYQNISYGEDYDLWVRGWFSNKKMMNLREVLVYYRIHSGQMTDIVFNKKMLHVLKN